MLGILAMVFSAILPFAQHYEHALCLLWLTSFFGALCLPNITGAYLVRVEPNDRPRAISFAYLINNLFGYLPAPVLYGVANELSGSKSSRLGMIVLMYTQSLFIVFTVMAVLVDKPSFVDTEIDNHELESINLK